jgi:hypothetical protein
LTPCPFLNIIKNSVHPPLNQKYRFYFNNVICPYTSQGMNPIVANLSYSPTSCKHYTPLIISFLIVAISL